MKLTVLSDDYITRGITLGANSSAVATALLLTTDPRAAAFSSLSSTYLQGANTIDRCSVSGQGWPVFIVGDLIRAQLFDSHNVDSQCCTISSLAYCANIMLPLSGTSRDNHCGTHQCAAACKYHSWARRVELKNSTKIRLRSTCSIHETMRWQFYALSDMCLENSI